MITKLKRKRIQSGLLQVELAAKAQVYPSTLSRFECGWLIPSPATAEKIAQVLDCEASELFDVSDNVVLSKII
jgi:transcriptional regulator with XRE-family HTH domain